MSLPSIEYREIQQKLKEITDWMLILDDKLTKVYNLIAKKK